MQIEMKRNGNRKQHINESETFGTYLEREKRSEDEAKENQSQNYYAWRTAERALARAGSEYITCHSVPCLFASQLRFPSVQSKLDK